MEHPATTWDVDSTHDGCLQWLQPCPWDWQKREQSHAWKFRHTAMAFGQGVPYIRGSFGGDE